MKFSQKILERLSKYSDFNSDSLSKRILHLVESILLEDKMTLQQAKDIFNLSSIPNSQELKSLYKKLALQNHPDRGGSEQKMALINAAYDILSNNTSTSSIHDDPEREERWNNIQIAMVLQAKKVCEEQHSKIDSFIEELKEYFSELSNNKYVFNGDYKSNKAGIDKLNPEDPKTYRYMYEPSIMFNISIYNEDRSIVFDIRLSTMIKYPSEKVLATPDMNINVYCDGIVNGRKNKIFQRNWGNTMNSSIIFENPREIFSNGKLEKILSGKARTKENSKFSKRDAIAYCTRVMDGKSYVSGKDIYVDIPLEGDLSEDKLFLRMVRGTFRGKGFWHILGIKKKTKYSSQSMNQVYVMMDEKEENFEKIREIVNGFDGDREKMVERLKELKI